jgi:hypothetical protein
MKSDTKGRVQLLVLWSSGSLFPSHCYLGCSLVSSNRFCFCCCCSAYLDFLSAWSCFKDKCSNMNIKGKIPFSFLTNLFLLLFLFIPLIYLIILFYSSVFNLPEFNILFLLSCITLNIAFNVNLFSAC